MKICFVNQDMSLGGSATVVHDIVFNWPCKEDKLFLIVFYDLFDKRYLDLYKVENLKIFILNKTKTIDFNFLKNLKSTLKEIKPDAISTHLTCVFYLKLIKQHKKSNIFHTIHAEPNCDLPKIYRFFLKRDFAKQRIKLIGCCDYISKKANELYGVYCKTIRNGFSCAPRQKKIKTNIVRFLFVGRFCNIKNIYSIIDAFNLLPDGIDNFEFKICGYGSQQETDKIRTLLLNSKRREKFHYFGKVNNLNHIYEDSDILILASFREGLPITVLEAISYGLGCIVTKVGGIPEYVIDNFNGLYLDGTDSIDIMKGILRILSNTVLVKEFSCNAKKLLYKMSAEKMSIKYMEYIKYGK